MTGPLELARSAELLARARRVIPGASQTFSKGPTQWLEDVAPSFAARGEGPFLWDVDGNRYYDLPLALGPMILGYAHPAVVEAVARHLPDGVSFTLPHRLEVEVAERIVTLVPCAEMVRFGKTGSDAVSAAVRAARALTGRDRVALTGYHGWHDWHIGATTRNAGVPEAVRALSAAFPLNDLAALDAVLAGHPGEWAAIVVEPGAAREPTPEFLRGVRERADADGALLILDEVVTGFRVAVGGAQERYGVTADLACFGKALANGLPLSAVTGPERHMRAFEKVFYSGTHGGETLALAAAAATLGVIVTEDVVAGLWAKGERLMSGLRAAAARHGLDELVAVTGAAPRAIITVAEPDPDGPLLAKSLLQQELARRGVLFNGAALVCHALTEAQVDDVCARHDEAFAVLAARWPDGLAGALDAPPLQSVFIHRPSDAGPRVPRA